MSDKTAAQPAPAELSDGLPVPQRYWAVLTLILGVSMAVLDSSIVNVALPSIARELGTSPASSVWIINAYQLAVIATLLPLSSLGETIGYRTIYVGGLMEYYVRLSRQCANLESEAKPASVKASSDEHLRPRILASDA